jgi:SAM-dependent methyltransferase
VSVIEGGFDAELPGHGMIDAVVGRRVLMYQEDPVAAVEALGTALKPGGVFAFHEHDASKLVPGRHPLPLHDEVRDWLAEMLRREGARLDMGLTLHEVMSAAGLAVESVRAEANLLTPDSSYPVGMIVRAVMPPGPVASISRRQSPPLFCTTPCALAGPEISGAIRPMSRI